MTYCTYCIVQCVSGATKLADDCAHGQRLSFEHALTCQRGGYIAMRHDEVRDLFTALLLETCHNVATTQWNAPQRRKSHRRRPPRHQGRRLLCNSGFKATFFDVRVFIPYDASYQLSPPQRIFDAHESAKAQAVPGMDQKSWVRKLCGLDFSSTGATGWTSEAFLRRVASFLLDKTNTSYSETMGWLRCRVSFAILRATVLCFRGARATDHTSQPCPCPKPGCSASQCAGTRDLSLILSKLL